MAQVIDLEGLPEPIAQAIMETVLNLKSRYRAKTDTPTKFQKELPSGSGSVMGSLRRIDIYEDR